MIEVVRHTLGLCEDNHSHIDLLDIVLYGFSGLGFLIYQIRNYISTSWLLFISYFNKEK